MILRQRRRPRPLALILLAVLLQAVVHGTLTGRIDPAGSLLFSAIAFGTSAAVFGTVLFRRRGVAGRRTLQGHLRTMVGMNVATALTFLSFYVSLALVPAATTAAVETAVGPLAVVVLAPLILGRRLRTAVAERVIIATLMVLALLLAADSWLGSDGEKDASTVVGLLLAVTAGWGMAAVTLLSRKLGEARVGAVAVSAHRFHLTYLVAVVLWWAREPPAPRAGELVLLAALGIIAVVVPLFLLQIGLQQADPLAAIAVIVALPGLTYLVQLAAGAPFDRVTFGLVLAVILTSAAFSVRHRATGGVADQAPSAAEGR